MRGWGQIWLGAYSHTGYQGQILCIWDVSKTTGRRASPRYTQLPLLFPFAALERAMLNLMVDF